MQWQTHAVVGANAIWLTVLFGADAQAPALLMGIGAFAGLLPDIDATGGKSYGAKIHYIAGGILKPTLNVFRHRGFFHSFLAVALAFSCTIPLAYFVDPFAPAVFALGYASHLFIDNFNCGMEVFYPLKKRVTFVPRFLQFRVGSAGDQLFLLIGILGLYLYIQRYLLTMDFTQIIPTLFR